MKKQHERTLLLIGEEGLKRLSNQHVLIIGIGGVGSFVVEGLVRAGIGAITLIDFDVIQESNINRQIMAYYSTIGQYKVNAMKTRILDINPECQVTALPDYFKPDHLLMHSYDYVIDAIDSVDAKVNLLKLCYERRIPVISSMGTGNKLDNESFQITDISKTHTCPLARIIRKKLRENGIEKGIKVLFSTAIPSMHSNHTSGEHIGSISTVPSVAGLLIAGNVITEILKRKE